MAVPGVVGCDRRHRTGAREDDEIDTAPAGKSPEGRQVARELRLELAHPAIAVSELLGATLAVGCFLLELSLEPANRLLAVIIVVVEAVVVAGLLAILVFVDCLGGGKVRVGERLDEPGDLPRRNPDLREDGPNLLEGATWDLIEHRPDVGLVRSTAVGAVKVVEPLGLEKGDTLDRLVRLDVVGHRDCAVCEVVGRLPADVALIAAMDEGVPDGERVDTLGEEPLIEGSAELVDPGGKVGQHAAADAPETAHDRVRVVAVVAHDVEVTARLEPRLDADGLPPREPRVRVARDHRVDVGLGCRQEPPEHRLHVGVAFHRRHLDGREAPQRRHDRRGNRVVDVETARPAGIDARRQHGVDDRVDGVLRVLAEEAEADDAFHPDSSGQGFVAPTRSTGGSIVAPLSRPSNNSSAAARLAARVAGSSTSQPEPVR